MTKLLLGAAALVFLAGCATLCKIPLVSSVVTCPTAAPTPGK